MQVGFMIPITERSSSWDVTLPTRSSIHHVGIILEGWSGNEPACRYM